MSNLVFPSTIPGMRIQMSRAPSYSTQTVFSQSRKRYSSTWETYPLYAYSLDFELLRSGSQVEFQKLFGFYARHFGGLDSFLFTDDEDNTVTAHPFGVGNGSTTDFQLQRTLVASADLAAPASRTYWTGFADGYEPIFDLNSAPSIFDNAVLKTVTTDYTLPGNGVVHFLAAPVAGHVLTWTGTYYRRVRFDADTIQASRIVQTFWEARSIRLVSVKP